jgi:hypothetical protein
VIERGVDATMPSPPWLGVPPALDVYRARGHRRLDARTFADKCTTCIWGCRMPVEMIIDQWNRARSAIGRRPSAMARWFARSTKPAPRVRSPVGKG